MDIPTDIFEERLQRPVVAVLRPRLVADTNFVVEGIESPQHGWRCDKDHCVDRV
jgi:hypothetical protein